MLGVVDVVAALGVPLGVVVRGVLGQHPAEVSFPEDQHPVGEFGADGQHEAFGEAVRPRTPGWDLDHLDARIREHRVERAGVLPGPIADEEPKPRCLIAEVHDELPPRIKVQVSISEQPNQPRLLVLIKESGVNQTYEGPR